MKTQNRKTVTRLREVLDQCARLRSDLHSIKNMAYKTKRRIDMGMKTMRDMVRSTNKKQAEAKRNRGCADAQEDKENNINAMNKMSSLSKIEVDLPIKEDAAAWKEPESKLTEKIMLELQEIKLLEQRENLIRKKNERMINYYSENKKRLDITRSQVYETQK